MNFLSHLFLSGSSEGLILGNFIADSVKGSAYKNYAPEIQQGIVLHRHIDTFTDSHPIVELSKERLRPVYHKYASVIVDVYYDHFLAANWSDYSAEPLHDYTQRIYALIQKNEAMLPLQSAQFTKYMVHYNILEAYSHLDGIDRVLKGMAKRTTFVSHMEKSVKDLEEHYALFENEFRLFFPELQQFVNGQINIS